MIRSLGKLCSSIILMLTFHANDPNDLAPLGIAQEHFDRQSIDKVAAGAENLIVWQSFGFRNLRIRMKKARWHAINFDISKKMLCFCVHIRYEKL